MLHLATWPSVPQSLAFPVPASASGALLAVPCLALRWLMQGRFFGLSPFFHFPPRALVTFASRPFGRPMGNEDAAGRRITAPFRAVLNDDDDPTRPRHTNFLSAPCALVHPSYIVASLIMIILVVGGFFFFRSLEFNRRKSTRSPNAEDVSRAGRR